MMHEVRSIFALFLSLLIFPVISILVLVNSLGKAMKSLEEPFTRKYGKYKGNPERLPIPLANDVILDSRIFCFFVVKEI